MRKTMTFSAWEAITPKMEFHASGISSCMILLTVNGKIHNITQRVVKSLTHTGDIISFNFCLFNDYRSLEKANATVQVITTHSGVVSQ